MKPGDKVWYFFAGTQTIEDDVVREVVEYTKGAVWIHTRKYVGILGVDFFPTREALCEHYSKIFE